MFRKIPVYGSLVTVELDEGNELLAINSALGDPVDVDPVASRSPAEVIQRVQQLSGAAEPPTATPRLVYYYDREAGRWHLAYLLEDVPTPGRTPAEEARAHGHVSLLADFVVDAHTGELIAELPRTPNVSVDAEEHGPVDEPMRDVLGRDRTIRTFRSADGWRMYDPEMNVHTYDLGFGSIYAPGLPGTYVVNPPSWAPDAVSAHANAVEVARFLAGMLKRSGIDGRGGPLVSSVNCTISGDGSREWNNAAWYRNQMVYGQRTVEGRLRSYAAGLDVVAHEIFHGVTSATARLQYVGETGALNESYSDIFGVIVSNVPREIPDWDWRLGEDVDGTGIPLRDLRDPGRHGQPAHMDEYFDWPPSRDNGGVHYNSGIHNRAAYLILTARSEDGRPLFDAASGAALFYLALTQYLSRTSSFRDSRNAVQLVGRTLFRHDEPARREARLQAIVEEFDTVGIR